MILRPLVILSLVLVAFAAGARAQAQQPAANTPDQAHLIASVESYLRNLFSWGPAFQLKLGPLKDAQLPGFYEVPIAVTFQEQTDTGIVYASKDGKYIIRGELYNTSQDPFAETRAKLVTKDSPSQGPANAKVTVVEFSDFQCPHCRVLSQTLKTLVPKYPQVHFVFKNFPITQIHPWAMTAAIAGRCAYPILTRCILEDARRHLPATRANLHGDRLRQTHRLRRGSRPEPRRLQSLPGRPRSPEIRRSRRSSRQRAKDLQHSDRLRKCP